ncbi:MAG: signal recognition particle receptor subunit alpha [Candidatus Anstonellales archaeon]
MGIGEKIRDALDSFARRHAVDEKSVKALIRDIERILISSDVDVEIVLKLGKEIEKEALAQELKKGLTLREHVLRVVYDKLVQVMGEGYTMPLKKGRIMVAGIYGVGKTTTAVKLAKYLMKKGLSAAVLGADLSRPAALDQLRQLAEENGVRYYGIKEGIEELPSVISGIKEDVVIVDSAGRDGMDERLKKDLQRTYELAKPDEVFLVVSADMGQEAKAQAIAFREAVPLSALIVTRVDGSGKGGAALSSASAAGAKVAFIGTGEKVGDFEEYDPKSYIARLLGMPDIKAIMEKFKEAGIEAQEIPEEITADVLLQQIKQARKAGPLDQLFSMVGMKAKKDEAAEKMKKIIAIIESMTKEERKDVEIVKKSKSRMARIAKGAGVGEKDVASFIKEFEKMKKLFDKVKKDRKLRGELEKMVKNFG